MKIGILTYHSVPNFGAQLQATSTVGYLKRMGHEPIVLNWYPKDLEDMYANRVSKEQIEAHNAYTNKYLPITSICRTEKDLLNTIEKNNLKAIIVGSDALFKYVPQKHRVLFSKRKLKFIKPKLLFCDFVEGNPFFGGFAKNLKKKIPIVAFSVSSENCAYQIMNSSEISEMNTAMDFFSYISVRDEWTKEMVETITGKKNIEVTPDPVFSFNQNNYIHLPSKDEILNKYHLENEYILISFSTYYGNTTYINKIAEEVKKRGYQPVAFPMPEELFAADIKTRISLPLSPIDWYALIVHSSGYIGERMHPIVVSLHNSVPFWVFDQYGVVNRKVFGFVKKYVKESSKIYHILHEAGMDDLLYSYMAENTFPTPKYILDRIEQFDKEKCRSFAVMQQKRYEKGMNLILDKIK